jgi:hypothetical protein
VNIPPAKQYVIVSGFVDSAVVGLLPTPTRENVIGDAIFDK